MSFSFDASVGTARDAVTALDAILAKAEAAPNAASLPEKRIHDMLPLVFQVHMVTDLSQKMAAHLSGSESLALDRDLKTLAEMRARVAQVQGLLAKAQREPVDAHMAKIVPLELGPDKTIQVPGSAYAYGYGLPNIFHLTTAYDILRKESVPLGKIDYVAPFAKTHMPHELPA